MELKEYQQKSLDQIKNYLKVLVDWQKKSKDNPELDIDFPLKAWDKAQIGRTYHSRKNGLGQFLPNFCLKIPTGGGKTFLAVKVIDMINTVYRRKRTGLILWVVPTNQIYHQTIQHLRNREHPYRQHLDIASGGKTIVLEKTNHFTPLDVEENLVVLMLMLPSASRKTKETLRVFRDNGGFMEFFPSEDKIADHNKMLEQFPNLDAYGSDNGFWGKQIKTSLGNTLRTLFPVIILDEGHKAYSETAQDTLRGFNPSIIVELSATPHEKSNILVDIRGMELNREEMIKLDLHVINKASPDWKDTLLASVEKTNYLQKVAKKYEANSGVYIRPICLIQAERTGKEQRGSKYIHSEDVREYLIKTAGVPKDHVAVTSAEVKEIEGVDLLSKDCSIRYIITKQALQEGWDCSFAYILTVLTNPNSKNAMTQLVGRILRQPFARKTGIKDLDESYVFTFQQKAASILACIKSGFEDEGLGDLVGQVVADEMPGEEGGSKAVKAYKVRKEFMEKASKTLLPVFIVKHGTIWKPLNYEMDIEGGINWKEVDLNLINNLVLSEQEDAGMEVAIGLSDDEDKLIASREVIRTKDGGIEIDIVFFARHLLDLTTNPWIAFDFSRQVVAKLIDRYDEKIVANNFVFIIEEMRKHLMAEKDRLAKKVFETLLTSNTARFMIISKGLGFSFPKSREVKSTAVTLTKANGQALQRSLFEFVPEDEFNEVEKHVAWYLEEQGRLFFWYRNRPKRDYAIQGWKKNRIYPDFIFTELLGKGKKGMNSVFVVETKGVHLKNEDTDYKKSIFDICNENAKKMSVGELGLKLKNMKLRFEVIFTNEWKKKLNELLVRK
jgi:type III restriction enzyme